MYPLNTEGHAVRAISSLLPSNAGSAVYAELTPHPPKPRLKAVSGPQADRHPRTLSDKQRRTVLGSVVERVQGEVKTREGRYLRRLDSVHVSGYRTNQNRWNALGAIIEPVMARVDIATLILGWLDDRGQFRLNRQRGLAEDSGMTESRVSRTLSLLEQAGYVHRQMTRLYKHGQNWVTRVTIRLRVRFFVDLGLGHQLAEARTRSRQRRKKQVAEVQQQLNHQRLNGLLSSHMRRESHNRAQGKRRAQLELVDNAKKVERMRERAAEIHRLATDYPELSRDEICARVNLTHP